MANDIGTVDFLSALFMRRSSRLFCGNSLQLFLTIFVVNKAV